MASLLFGTSKYLDELYNELYWEGVAQAQNEVKKEEIYHKEEEDKDNE